MSVESGMRVRLRNQPGELARVAEQLGNAGVNIRALAGVASGDESLIEFLVDNAAEASRVWREAGTSFDEVRVAVAWLPDRPGALAMASRVLADAGINLESTYVVDRQGGRAQVAFGCVDAQKADESLASVAEA
jgi:hypothetical protein